MHVIGSKTGYTTVDKASAKTAAIAGLLDVPDADDLRHRPRRVRSSTATAGTWGPAPVTLAYQWYRVGHEDLRRDRPAPTR